MTYKNIVLSTIALIHIGTLFSMENFNLSEITKNSQAKSTKTLEELYPTTITAKQKFFANQRRQKALRQKELKNNTVNKPNIQPQMTKISE